LGNVKPLPNERESFDEFESDDDQGHGDEFGDNRDGVDTDFDNIPEDTCECEKHIHFFVSTCGCKQLYKVPCSSLVNKEVLIDYRKNVSRDRET
jgi:hypothetical protein